MTKIYSHILLIGLLLFGGNVFGQLTIGTASVANTQNFDGMGNSGTATLPTGFKIGTDWSTGTTATTLAYGTTGTGAVTSTSGGGAINWANGVTASSTDRGLGFLSTSGYTSPRSIIFAFTNNTGSTVTSLDISFDYEKYRSGTRAFDWNFFHGSTSTAATAATSGDQAYSADANNTTIFNPPTSISKSFSITGLSIANGSTYYLRWTYTGNGGSTNGQGLGIDNFSITLTTSAPTNTITTSTSISGSPFCVTASTGAAVSVDFTSTGTFTSNTYTAQLSNASGSFASPVNIGTLSSNANLGTINATIPANTATGTGYRIRVISNGPSATGTDNGTNLTINLAANAVAPSTAQNIATGANGATLTVTEQSSPTSRVWKYGTSSGTHPTSTGITGTTYTPNFATAGTYYVVCESTYPCGVIKSNEVIITVVNAPANDNCNNAISLTVNSSETCTSTTSGTLLNASSSIAAINCGGNTGTANDDVWYTFKATATSHIISVTPSNSWDVVVEVLSGSCNGTNINCADAFAASTTPEVITLTGLTINSDYLVRIYSYNSTTPATPTFTVCVTTPPPVCLFEGFEGASPPSGWTYSSITQNTNNPRTGSYSAIFNGNNDEMISPMIATPGTLSFWYKRSGTAPGSPAFLVYYGSSTTGPWTQIGSTIASFSTTYQEFTADLSSQSNIYIRILHTRSSGTNEIYLDDFSVSCNSCTAPTNPNGTISGATTACGSSILSYTHGSGQPLSGVSYFWQTSPTGTSTTLNTTDDFEITGSGNYYVRAKKDGEACWSAGATAAYAVTIINTTTSISPTADQNLITGNNGTQLTVTEGSTTSSRQWMYSTTSGSGYQTISGQTGLNYIPNFASAGVYYVVCASTYSTCGTIITNEVKINVAAPGPPVITHTPLINTTSTSTQTATVTISSTTAITCATLTYRVDGGSWQTPVNGTLSGGLYSFPIPGQVAGSMIEYFITACNSAGTVTSPNGVSTSSPYGSFHEYTINCTPPSSGTQTIAFQGFEFVSSSSYTFSVDNTNTAPTDALKQNYPAHPNAIEWRYFNQKPNGSLTDATRNSCGCMAETFSGLPGCPNPSNPVYSAGGSTGICRTFSGNSRGVYGSTTATENPANSRSRNGSYSYIQISRNDGGDGPISFIYFDDVTIPDAANATNIKVIAYVSSISTSVTNNGAESADYVTLSAAYNSTGTPNNMVNDITCGSDWYFYSSDISATVTGSTNQRWDFAGNLWNTTPAISGTTSKNKIVLSIPNGTTNVRAMI